MSFRFLVVDDSELNLVLASTLFTRLGIQCDTVTDAEHAYEMVLNNDYDMVYMDYLMPGTDGIAATRHIRTMTGGQHTEDYYRNLPIVGLTAEDSREQLKELMESGLNDIIFKPIRQEDVEVVIARWCTEPELPDIEDEIRIYGISPESIKEMIEVDAGSFRDMLWAFGEDIPDKHVRIEKALLLEDYQSYTVEVHRIKGEARMIGAPAISEEAKDLEMLGKALTGVVPNGQSDEINKATIKADTPHLMEEIDKMYRDIARIQAAHAQKQREAQAQVVQAAQTDGSVVFTEKEITKLRRYTAHALEALDEQDYRLARDWIEELGKMLSQQT